METTQHATKAVVIDPVELSVRMLKLALHDRESVFYVSKRCRALIRIGFPHSEVRRIMTRYVKRRIRTLVYRARFTELRKTVEHALRLHLPEDVLTRAVEHSVAKAFGKNIVSAKSAAEYMHKH
jgi:hypothetical protein